VLADALLVLLAIYLVVTGPRPITAAAVGLCAAAVLLGAWLGCLAVWWQPSSRPPPTEPGPGKPAPLPES
jgi:hypothetical protein